MAIDVAKRCWYPVLLLVLKLSSLDAGERWSRQLTDFGNGAGNDWIPLAQPCPTCRPGDRQAGAKVLNYFDNTGFLGNDNSAQPQHHHFTFVNQPFPAAGQSSRFPPLPVPQPLQQDFESAFNQPFGNHQSFLQQSPFGGIQTIQRHPIPSYSAEPSTKDTLVQEKPQILEQQQQQFQFPLPQQSQTNNIRQPLLQTGGQSQPGGGGVSQEEVQLLYVPVETLYNQKPPQQESSRFNGFPQPVSASLINDFYTSVTTTPKPRTTQIPFTTRTTTSAPLPVKPKPNQPPLAMFMYNEDKQSKVTIADALGNLKNVNQIAVIDSLNKNLPKVFIGPSGLAPPKGYSKFELPYLSSIDQNRLDRKLDSLPFFVAPLSYKTPSGFSKIPLPSPHVGSVIVQQASSSPASNFYRQPENIQYYQPATLKFTEATTKAPITVPAGLHYTAPSNKPTTDRSNYSRGNTQTSPESYRQPQADRALHSHSPFNSVNNQPNRHIVNEEYFNLAKTKKPTTSSTSLNYTPKTYKPFEFKPIPDQKIPSFVDSENHAPSFTTSKPVTTTERAYSTDTQEDTQLKTHFKEEHFRNRRPYSGPTVAAQPEEDESLATNQNNHEEEHFVHKFKLVNSVRPQNTPTTKSVVDNAYLEFFQQQDNHDTLKTTVNNHAPSGAHHTIRNNYFQPSTNEDAPKQKFVSTYYVPTTTPVTPTTTTTVSPKNTGDSFFEDFEEKSRLFESDRPRYSQQTRPVEQPYSSDSYVNRFSENSYINKYKYETNTNEEVHYPVEVVTTQDPLRYDTTSESSRITTPSSEQSYSIPSELPPISANLPGLVNSLMEDEWSPQKNGNHQPGTSAATTSTAAKGHFRKTAHRTSTAPVTPDPYSTEVTTRRVRGRRPTTTSTTGDYTAPTRATTVNRSRSRYVPSSEERPAVRSRTRSRPHSNSRVAKEEENLDYQRDVLKQNYPVIRSGSQSISTSTSTPPPTTTSTTTTTHATTMPLTYAQIFEEQTDRLNLYPMAHTEHIPAIPTIEEGSNLRKETYNSENYDSESTSPFAPTTIRQNGRDSTVPQDDESVRVLPVNYQSIEPQRETPIKSVEIQREQPIHSTRRHPVKQEPEPETPSNNNQQEDGQDFRKVEITPRPRRPLLRQPVYSPRTTIATERATPERTTIEPSRGSPQRRPAFVRRPGRPLYTTTTAAPTTTYSSRGVSGDDEQSTQGAFTVRPKTRQDILRARTRRPLTTYVTPTTTASPEPSVTRGFARTKELRRVSPTIRSRQEQQPQQQEQEQTSEKQPESQTPRFRIRERTRFSLQPQESQWSAKLVQNSFQPVQSVESRHKTYEEEHYSLEPEPEIVTANPFPEENIRLVNVSANLAGTPSTTPAGVLTKEVALSQMPPQADDSNIPSFAELLNDVMKEYIDDSIHPEAEAENKPVENEVLNNAEKPSPELQRSSANVASNGFEKKSTGVRNGYNFRKRGRSHAVDSFETAESQHINSHVLNTAGIESLKSIDKAYLRGKNVGDDAKGTNYVTPQSNHANLPAQMELVGTTAVSPAETTISAIVETTSAIETTSVLPTEKETTTPPPTVEVLLGDDEQTSTEQFYDDVAELEQDDQPPSKEATNQGIFADVKKQLSDLFAMAESDPDTEEDDERYGSLMMGYQPAERMTTSTAEPEFITSTTTEPPPSENRAESTVSKPLQNAVGSLAIPTSTSNGITHETEICYRGRCVKTEEKKPKKNKFKPN